MGQRKQPRRTAERILEVTHDLYNRFGEPNVSTTLIATELGISPGNLYYHYPAKEELVNGLFDLYERRLHELLPAAAEVRDVEEAWLFFHLLFELIWQYRFLYRDLNELLSRNRRLELRWQAVLRDKTRAVHAVIQGLARQQVLQMQPREAEPVATSMVVVLTYWLSFEYARNPRQALEPGQAGEALSRGAHHVLGLLLPLLQDADRRHLRSLTAPYQA